MTDYIKRSEATELVANYFEFAASLGDELRTKLSHASNINDRLAEVPAADVRPVVRGKWIADDDGDGMHCSVCKTDFCYSVCGFVDFNFCPNCGASMADMRGVDND